MSTDPSFPSDSVQTLFFSESHKKFGLGTRPCFTWLVALNMASLSISTNKRTMVACQCLQLQLETVIIEPTATNNSRESKAKKANFCCFGIPAVWQGPLCAKLALFPDLPTIQFYIAYKNLIFQNWTVERPGNQSSAKQCQRHADSQCIVAHFHSREFS